MDVFYRFEEIFTKIRLINIIINLFTEILLQKQIETLFHVCYNCNIRARERYMLKIAIKTMYVLVNSVVITKNKIRRETHA
jgi:ABC-type bacteriocin/lantibiotic exporter with double-glycine peptidase domain